MANLIVRLMFCLLFVSFLTACTYNPQTSHLSRTDECTTLQRQMLFSGSYQPNNSQLNTQMDRQQIQKQFRDLNCYSVLSDAQQDQTQK